MSKNKTKRNAPCPCGSGLKYKKCCLKYDSNPKLALKKGQELEQEYISEELKRWEEYKKKHPDALPGLAIQAQQQGKTVEELEIELGAKRKPKDMSLEARMLMASMLMNFS